MEKELDLSMNMEEIISSYEKVESEHNHIDEKIKEFDNGDKRTAIFMLPPMVLFGICGFLLILTKGFEYNKDVTNFMVLSGITGLGWLVLFAIILSAYEDMIKKYKKTLNLKSKFKTFILKPKIKLLEKRSILENKFSFLSKPDVQENIKELFAITQPPLFSNGQIQHALACTEFNNCVNNKDYLNAVSVLKLYFKDKEVILEKKLDSYL